LLLRHALAPSIGSFFVKQISTSQLPLWSRIEKVFEPSIGLGFRYFIEALVNVIENFVEVLDWMAEVRAMTRIFSLKGCIALALVNMVLILCCGPRISSEVKMSSGWMWIISVGIRASEVRHGVISDIFVPVIVLFCRGDLVVTETFDPITVIASWVVVVVT
jgi:hypothetical protein